MGLPHINVMSKMDLVKGLMAKKELKKFFTPEPELLDEDERMGTLPKQQKIEFQEEDEEEEEAEEAAITGLEDPTDSKNVMRGISFSQLNRAVAQLIDEFGLVSFLQLDVRNEDSVGSILSYIDDTIQFHEAQEPKEPKDEEFDMDNGDED